jgi:hypothetical protein
MSGKYYPNNWQEYKDLDEDNYIRHTFEELMTWKVANWELPASVVCVIRVSDRDTLKVLGEYTYQRKSAAEKKVQQLINTPNVEFIVCDHQAIHHFSAIPADSDD